METSLPKNIKVSLVYITSYVVRNEEDFDDTKLYALEIGKYISP